jgi:hypothetical protein
LIPKESDQKKGEIIVGVLISEQTGEIVLVRNRTGANNFLFKLVWANPENGESFERALLRGIAMKTGLQLTHADLHYKFGICSKKEANYRVYTGLVPDLSTLYKEPTHVSENIYETRLVRDNDLRTIPIGLQHQAILHTIINELRK